MFAGFAKSSEVGAQTPRRRTVELLARTDGERTGYADTARTSRWKTSEIDPRGGVHQVPAAVSDFRGPRPGTRLAQGACRGCSDDGRTDTVVVFGAPGSGKTSLTPRAGSVLREQFADGCLYLNLRGADPQLMSPLEAMYPVLEMFGVRAEEIHGTRRGASNSTARY